MADNPNTTTSCILKPTVVDRLACLLVAFQKADPKDVLLNIAHLRQLSAQLLKELQAVRGPWVVCYLCNPPFRLKTEDIYEHDTTLHGAYKSR